MEKDTSGQDRRELIDARIGLLDARIGHLRCQLIHSIVRMSWFMNTEQLLLLARYITLITAPVG
jgi:hypothetical protein